MPLSTYHPGLRGTAACRLSRWLGFISLLSLACGDSSPQAPVQPVAFSPDKLVGRWQALVPQYYIYPNIYADSLTGEVTIDTTSYRINISYSNDSLDISFLETGDWHWDSQNEKLLFFDYRQFALNLVRRRHNQILGSSERAVAGDTSGGAWYCRYILEDGRITLFNTSGWGAGTFSTIILNPM